MSDVSKIIIFAATVAIGLSAAILSSPAPAADFAAKFTQIDGTEPLDGAGKPLDLTLGKVVTEALLAVFPDEQNLAGAEKVRRFVLATKIQANPKIELTAEETTLVKQLVGKMYPPLIVGQAWRALDPGSVPK